MKNKYNILVTAFLAVWLVVGVTACGDDNSTDPGEEESCNIGLPSEFAPVTVDVSYFAEQTEPERDEPQFSTYFMVQDFATQANAIFGGTAVFSLAPSLIAYAQFAVSPEFQDGSCVWTISPPPSQLDGLDVTVTIMGTSTSSGVNWEIVYDGELTSGETVDNYLILTGSTSEENQVGQWNYYDPENQDSPVLVYQWDIESEEDYDLSVTANEDEFPLASLSYAKGGVQNTLTMNTEDGTIMAYWDEDLDSGWIETPGQDRQCYNTFRNEQCQ